MGPAIATAAVQPMHPTDACFAPKLTIRLSAIRAVSRKMPPMQSWCGGDMGDGNDSFHQFTHRLGVAEQPLSTGLDRL